MKLETKLFSQMLMQSAKDYPDRPAITSMGSTITYAQLKTAVTAAAWHWQQPA